MKMVTESGWIAASPEQVWERIARLDWPAWDPDLARVDTVQGGMTVGGRCRLIMNNGVKMTIGFPRLDPYERIEWTGATWAGTLQSTGIIELAPDNGGTEVTYHFALHGLLGGPMMRLMDKKIVHGTAGCVAGLIREVPQ